MPIPDFQAATRRLDQLKKYVSLQHLIDEERAKDFKGSEKVLKLKSGNYHNNSIDLSDGQSSR